MELKNRITVITLILISLLCLFAFLAIKSHKAVGTPPTIQPKPTARIPLPSNLPNTLSHTVVQIPQFTQASIEKIRVPNKLAYEFEPASGNSTDLAISQDGWHVVAIEHIQIGVSLLNIFDLRTGKTKPLQPFGRDGVDLLSSRWDPHNSDYFYITAHGFAESATWRMRFDGSHKKRISPSALFDIEDGYALPPDGKRIFIGFYTPLLHDRVPASLIGKQQLGELGYLFPRGHFSERKIVDRELYRTLSPDGQMAFFADPTSNDLLVHFYDHRCNRMITISRSNVKPVLQVPYRVELYNEGWLSDSSGVLVNAHIEPPLNNPGAFDAIEELWLISTNGTIRRLARDVYLQASSIDGRHWLFYSEKSCKLVSRKR